MRYFAHCLDRIWPDSSVRRLVGVLVFLDFISLEVAVGFLIVVVQVYGVFLKKTNIDSIRVSLDPVFVSKELYQTSLDRIGRLERKTGINGSG